MATSPFRHRGVRVVVDTVETAEFDMQIYDIAPEIVDTIGRALVSLPQSTEDRAVGNFLIREIAGFDVVFIIGREDTTVVITIGRIRPPDPANPTELLLKSAGIAAIFRGATGF